MNFDSQTIDEIVSGVLRQLGSGTIVCKDETSARHPAAVTTPLSAIPPADGKSSSHYLDAQVITEEVLQKSVVAKKHVLIREDAIITPSGRDWLRQQKVRWERQSDQQQSDLQNAVRKQGNTPCLSIWTLLLKEGTAQNNGIAQNNVVLEKAASSAGWDIGRAENAAEVESSAFSLLLDNQAAKRGVVCSTNAPERMVCRANRHAGIRAAVVVSQGDVRRVQKTLGANLIVLSDTERSFFELRNLMSAISAGGPPIEPTDWSE